MITARAKRMAIMPLLLLVAGCKEEAQAPRPLRPVLTMTVAPTSVETFGPFASVVEARYQTQIGFQLAGRMVSRDVYVGDVVRAGQRLAALDPVVTQFALTRAKADVADAKAQLINAEGVEARQRTLVTGGNTAQATLDNAVASRDTAKARLDQAQAALNVAMDQMSYTELRASFDGVITSWTAEVGQYVTNGQAIVTVARPDIREAVVDIPDELMGGLKVGMAFDVVLLADPSLKTTALLRELGPLADSATRSRRVRLTLVKPTDAFRIGTTITVSIQHPVAPHVVVPARLVLDLGGKPFVWILAPDGGSVSRRAVTVGSITGETVSIVAGLSDGEKVVTAGVHSLTDGQKVAGEAGAGITKAKETRL